MYKRILSGVSALVIIGSTCAAIADADEADIGIEWQLSGETESVCEGGNDAFGNIAAAKEDWEYNILDNATVEITKYNGNDEKPTIPSVINGKKVTKIGENAFQDCQSIKIADIPYGIADIGRGAFFNCKNLNSLTLPDSVETIGESAFSYCICLESVRIPGSVTSIKSGAFDCCYSLKRINVDTGNSVYSGINGFLLNKYGDNLICCPAGVTQAAVPDGVTTIGSSAFSHCRDLTDISLPQSVTDIGRGAFYDCNSLTSIIIPYGVNNIENQTFTYCRSLKSITLPSSLKRIGDSAFNGCESLTFINIPNSVTEIGEDAFKYCNDLTSVTISKNVTSIGKTAFGSCENLTNITVQAGNSVYGSENGILFNKAKTKLICCPCGLKSVTLPKSLVIIADDAFFACTRLTSLTLPDGVNVIGNSAFCSCLSLESIRIPKSVTDIGEESFRNCPKLTIKCYDGSSAELYAKENGIKYEHITSRPTVPEIGKSSSSLTAVRLNWSKAKNASGYRIYKYNSSTKKWDTYKTLSGSSNTEYRVTGLKSGTTYKFKVKAYLKSEGATVWGDASEAYITATKPENVNIVKTGKSATSVRLYWNEVRCTGVKIQQYDNVSKAWKTVKLASGTNNAKITGLKKNTSYKFRILAYKKAGGKTLSSPWSASKTLTTKK